MIDDEQRTGPVDVPAGNWEYHFRDEDNALVAQMAINGASFCESEADRIAAVIQNLVQAACAAKRDVQSREREAIKRPTLILPPGPSGPIQIARN